MKEFGVSNHLVKKLSIEQRKGCSKRVLQNFFTMLATHTPIFLSSQELFDCFHRIQQVFASAQVTLLCPCSWCPLLECPFPCALLFFTKWFEFFYFSFCGEGGLGLKSEHVLYKKWIFWLFLAVLPTWHETDIYLLCGSYLNLSQMTAIQLHRSSQYNILISALVLEASILPSTSSI